VPRHEFDLIERLRQSASAHPRVTLGIGDDAAVVRFLAPAEALVTVDLLMEGVDFTLDSAAPERVGRKALAVSLSDIAAMAGRPLACFVAVALPRRGGFELGVALEAGLSKLALEFDVALAGGDTNTWDGPLVASVTVLGETTGRGAVRRSGARPGDWVMATGAFGGSLLGKHLDFTPRVREALALHAAVTLTSMIDASDGLAADLGHLLDESGAGAEIDEAAIPIAAAAHAAAARDNRPPLAHALSDGEDFELIFTVSPADGARLHERPLFDTPISRLGEIVSGSGCRLRTRDGSEVALPSEGWKHAFDEPP
jgi:thiamine-monophosphate kinase